MARSVKFKAFTATAMKKAKVIGSKGAKFIKDQASHPAVKNFAIDAVKIGAMSGGNPSVAGPMLAARAGQEADNIVDWSAHHFERRMNHM